MHDGKMEADRIIGLLGLEPHPEGGYFRETFRDAATVQGRACSTAIYFLLKEGQASHWHRVDAAEVWHWYAGAPLELGMARQGEPEAVVRLGTSFFCGHRPQVVVPAGCWQRARSLGPWTLVGCTVAPGFTFSGFELAAPGFCPVRT
ncbi:MAG: cupin domain-containing protein [Hyphomicrobiaceae bacterium]|nr:cupin domain-containing protein [Hyphomicrobiaceae bacterium]